MQHDLFSVMRGEGVTLGGQPNAAIVTLLFLTMTRT